MSTRWRALRKYFQSQLKQKLERAFELQDIPDLASPLHSHLTVHHDVKGTLSESVGSTDKTSLQSYYRLILCYNLIPLVPPPAMKVEQIL